MSKNNITGDEISTKVITESYRDNYDSIFRKKPEVVKDPFIAINNSYRCSICSCTLSVYDTPMCYSCIGDSY